MHKKSSKKLTWASQQSHISGKWILSITKERSLQQQELKLSHRKENTTRKVSKRKGIQEQLENRIDQGFEVATMSENRK